MFSTALSIFSSSFQRPKTQKQKEEKILSRPTFEIYLSKNKSLYTEKKNFSIWYFINISVQFTRERKNSEKFWMEQNCIFFIYPDYNNLLGYLIKKVFFFFALFMFILFNFSFLLISIMIICCCVWRFSCKNLLLLV